jgi:hypothetical protein
MAVRIAARSASCEPSIQAPWVMLAALWAGAIIYARLVGRARDLSD